MPTDPSVQQYIFFLSDKIRQHTTSYKYTGNLTKDAKILRLTNDQLNEALKSKCGITSIARQLFKKMVPEQCRNVEHWDRLTHDVLSKEQALIGK